MFIEVIGIQSLADPRALGVLKIVIPVHEGTFWPVVIDIREEEDLPELLFLLHQDGTGVQLLSFEDQIDPKSVPIAWIEHPEEVRKETNDRSDDSPVAPSASEAV